MRVKMGRTMLNTVNDGRKVPNVGFISLGCPKALVDSEQILTRLRAEGYDISGSYEGADLVVVNTCGFIDAAVEESLDAIGEALREAERLAAAGVRELLVISQDTGAYGVDLKYRTGFFGGRPLKTRLKELCMALAEFGVWVRLHYVYPYPAIDDLIPLMAEGKILPYLDVPFQHASPRILKAMKRPASSENTLARIRAWRAVCPELTIRSTFITGFPGETEAEFEELLAFLEEARLDRVGCFAYSPVAGAAANALPGALPDAVREERRRRLMDVQADISAERLAAKIGQHIRVIVDEADEDGLIARSVADAPEIDGQVFVNGFYDAAPGDFLDVQVVDASEHDLYAEIRAAR